MGFRDDLGGDLVSRCATVVVLAEDKRQQQLIRKYLRRRNFATSQIREVAAPVGQTQNVGYVLERYAVEVNAMRSATYSVGLIVVIDADDNTVLERKAQLEDELRKADTRLRAEGEAVALVVPRRNVETWIWHLEGNEVDEETDYKGKPVRPGHDMAEAKRQFAEFLVTGQEPFAGCPLSLQDARMELKRVPH